jgi:ribonuclease III
VVRVPAVNEPPTPTESPDLPAVKNSVESILGHSFARPGLLREAMTHRSATRPGAHGTGSNERLEFIGDRVLGLLMAEWLIERFPHEQEGDLGRRLALLVSQPVLAEVSEVIGLGEVLKVSPGEARAGVRRRATVLADVLEAALGALYLDGGIECARGFVRRAWDSVLAAQTEPPKDPKTTLQEWVQARGLDLPHYQVTTRSGPPHAPVFEVTVAAGEFSGVGTAGSKRAAEQLAAEALLLEAGLLGAGLQVGKPGGAGQQGAGPSSVRPGDDAPSDRGTSEEGPADAGPRSSGA